MTEQAGAAPLRLVPPPPAGPRWLIAGTPVDQRYPCLCKRAGNCAPAWCPCAGRDDAEALPVGCCSRRYSAAEVMRAKREYDASRRARD